MPHAPLLLPGYGAQGATARDLGAAFVSGSQGALVNSSRGISYAYKEGRYAKLGWREASVAATRAMIADLESAVGGR